MRLHNLKPASGSVKTRTRVGRGQGSGIGGTSRRGHNGAQSRSGYKVKRGFEGGQMPYNRRIPKFGFTNPFRLEYNVLNLEQLVHYMTSDPGLSTFDPEFYRRKRITSRSNERVKILGRGEINARVVVHAHKCSASAQRAIEAAGGEVVLLEPQHETSDQSA